MMHKHAHPRAGNPRRVRGVAAATLMLAAAAHPAAGTEADDTGVKLTVKPLESQYFEENRITVAFEYRVTRPGIGGIKSTADLPSV